jgi:hypothetical protein
MRRMMVAKTNKAIDHLNKAFSEISKARHLTKESKTVTKEDYDRIIQCFAVLGKMRYIYLDEQNYLKDVA